MPEQKPQRAEGATPFPLQHHGLIILIVVILLAMLIILLIRLKQGTEESSNTFNPQAVATGKMVDDALEEVYTLSGKILEIGDTYYVLSSESVRDGQVYSQRFKVTVTSETLYGEKHISFAGAASSDVAIPRSSLVLGDTVRVISKENIANADVFAATEIQRYVYEEEL